MKEVKFEVIGLAEDEGVNSENFLFLERLAGANRALQEKMGVYPIIGEAKEFIELLIASLYVRDQFIKNEMGISVKQFEMYIDRFAKSSVEKDKLVIQKRSGRSDSEKKT